MIRNNLNSLSNFKSSYNKLLQNTRVVKYFTINLNRFSWNKLCIFTQLDFRFKNKNILMSSLNIYIEQDW